MHNILFYTILVICNICKMYKTRCGPNGFTDMTYLRTYTYLPTINNYFNSQPFRFFRVLLTFLRYLFTIHMRFLHDIIYYNSPPYQQKTYNQKQKIANGLSCRAQAQ